MYLKSHCMTSFTDFQIMDGSRRGSCLILNCKPNGPTAGIPRNLERSLSKVTAPCKNGSTKVEHKASKTCSRFQSRDEWWEPVVWWLSNTQWTASGLGNNCTVNKNHMLATWVELALVFQIKTGVRLAPDNLDLRSQETIFRSIVKRI